jgi:hypothetical protein
VERCGLAPLKTVMNLHVPQNIGSFVTSFSRRMLLLGVSHDISVIYSLKPQQFKKCFPEGGKFNSSI